MRRRVCEPSFVLDFATQLWQRSTGYWEKGQLTAVGSPFALQVTGCWKGGWYCIALSIKWTLTRKGADTQTSIDKKLNRTRVIFAPTPFGSRRPTALRMQNLQSNRRGEKNIHSLTNAAYFWSKRMSNKNRRQLFYSFVGCAVMSWWWKPIHLIPSPNRRRSQDRISKPPKLHYSTQMPMGGSPPGNIQWHMRGTTRYEHLILFHSRPEVVKLPAECCCPSIHPSS